MSSRGARYTLPLLAIGIVATALAGCGMGEPAQEGEYSNLVETFVVQRTSIPTGSTQVALNQPVVVEFSAYLDPETFDYFDALLLTSGGIWASGFTRYRLTDRSLTFFPTRDLRPNLQYTLTVNPDTVRSLGGSTLDAPFALTFETASSGSVDQDRRVQPLSFLGSVQPIVERSCICHGQDPDLVGLTPGDLNGVASDELGDRFLVRPYDPPRSYLMHKILDDYPDRLFTVMPPPWAGAESLTRDEAALVETWITTGAMP